MTEIRLRVNAVEFSLGNLTLNGYKPENALEPNYLSGRQIAQCIDMDESATREKKLSKELKTMLGRDFSPIKAFCKMKSGGETKLNLWTIENAIIFWTYYATKGNSKAQELLAREKGIILNKQKIAKQPKPRINKTKNPEKYIQYQLQKKLGGLIEVECLAGRIDLLTSSQIIEIKQIKQWKEAIGQILVYGHYYPSHEKRIHLFGETQESYLNMIKTHCDKLGILLTWEY